MRERRCTCDRNGQRLLAHLLPPQELEDPCRLCKGYGLIWNVGGLLPNFNAEELARRHDQKIGWQ